MELRRYVGRLGVVLVVAQLALFVSGQDCLLAAGGRETPFRKLSRMAPRLPSGTQAIITSYKFGCCGNITAWQTYVQSRYWFLDRNYDISFQVWRPSPTVQESGCYSLVGENIFTSILPYRSLVSKTPEPSNVLTVQPGDVVGYYLLKRRDSNRDRSRSRSEDSRSDQSRDRSEDSRSDQSRSRSEDSRSDQNRDRHRDRKKRSHGMGEGIQLDASRTMDSVWYHTYTDSEPLVTGPSNCPFPVGSEADKSLTSFTNAAPVLSVSVSMFSCLPSPTSTMSPVLTVSVSSSPVPSLVPTPFSAALSNATAVSIAAVGVTALLLTLLTTLILVVIIAKVQHKRRRTSTETPSTSTNQNDNTLAIAMVDNEAYGTTSGENSLTESHLYETVNIGSEVAVKYYQR